MKRKMKSINVLAVAVLIIAVFFSGCSNSQHQNKEAAKSTIEYTCPMHPQIMEDHPGSCPICGMKLVKKSGEASERAGIDLNTVLQPVSSNAISTVNSVVPQQKSVPATINADGYLDFDTRTFNNIAARFSGRIEKLYIKFAFQEIHKRERIMDIYSPEMVTAQQDMLFLLKNSASETGLINAAKQKLLLLGMTGLQVARLERTKQAFYSLPVYSPYNGHVHDVAHSQMSGVPQENMSEGYTNNLPLAIKEGMYVEKGQTLFNVVDPHRLWAVLKIDQADMEHLKLGQPVTISLPDASAITLDGKIDFIEPVLRPGDKKTSIRVYLHNMDHSLKVNTIVKAIIKTGQVDGLWIPRTAVIDLGARKIVWLKRGSAYQAHQVTTGIADTNDVLIKSGITAADTLASNAQYLADSESFIKTKDHE
ncbi:MAG: efflux RND transporter periplasmic adaptor subunit [Bacteroidetes bacterium]|nr:efflux RND transporter periplasmic adaptor subunit [Bacteroidota bacterium]